MGTILQFGLLLIQYLPVAREGIAAAAELIGWGTDKIQEMVAEKRDPTPEEWGELNERIAKIRGPFQSDDE